MTPSAQGSRAWTRLALALCVALAASGCIAYRTGGARAVPTATEGAKKSIAVLVRASGTYRGGDRQLPDYVVAHWKQSVLRAYRESGLFSEVREGIGQGSDLQASVRVENTVFASRGITFLSGISFLVIPSRSSDQFQVQTTFTDGSGAVLGVLKSADSVTTYYQLLLLPATAFLSRDAVVSDTLYDLTLDTAAQAQRKGLL